MLAGWLSERPDRRVESCGPVPGGWRCVLIRSFDDGGSMWDTHITGEGATQEEAEADALAKALGG